MLPYLNSKVNDYVSFSVYSLVEENSQVLSNQQTLPLYKSDKIQGEFRASENNLGLILLRLTNLNKVNKGQMLFKMREKGVKEWTVENIYTVDQVQPNEYFAFGLPVLAEARNNMYQFELISLDGRKEDAIALSSRNPQFATVYNFLGSDLKNDYGLLAVFLYKKFLFAISNIDLIRTISIILLYYFVIFVVSKGISNRKVLKKKFSQIKLDKQAKYFIQKIRNILKKIEVD